MKRIDSVNARQDANGLGKQGFHDNADLAGQDATYLSPSWCNHVQEEIANAIEGFGTALNPNAKDQLFTVLKVLADDIAELKQDVKVGDLFLTMQDFEDSAAVAVFKGYGTWMRVGDGHALVTKASAENLFAPAFMKTIGSVGGEYNHQLTTNELPNFKLNFETGWAGGGSPPDSTRIGNSDGYANDGVQDSLFKQNTSSIGEDEPFAIMQPSVTIGVWQRLPDGASAPTYTLTANKNSVDEGEQITFILETKDLAASSLVDWSITGIQSDDISPSAMNGQFTVDAEGKAVYTLTAVADQKTEGNETLKFALSYIPNKSVNVLIVDISKYAEDQQVYYEGMHTIEVQPNQVITLDMYGSGGGGGGSVYSPAASPDGLDGGDITLSYLANTLVAGGGKHGSGGVWGNGSSYSNGIAGLGGTNTIAADASFEIQLNQNGNDAVIGSRYDIQTGGAAIASSIGANGGGNGATGIGDERWSYGGGGGSGGRLKTQFTNTTEEVITFNLIVGATGQGWKNGGNSGTDGGIGFAIVSVS